MSLISVTGDLGVSKVFQFLFLNIPFYGYFIGLIKDAIIAIMKTGPIPKHIALIMDGNRRYARVNHLALKDGHNAGAESLVQILDTTYKLGVEQVTVYAFSIENFNRPKGEVDTLFGLLRDRLRLISEHQDAFESQKKVKIRVLGNRPLIPGDILKDLEMVEEKTKDIDTKRVLNVCFPYTSRDEITHSVAAIASNEDSQDITASTLVENMYFEPDTPPLDILIRTSGHRRLSDFMLWQCNYNCTIEFVDTLWPDFNFFSITKLILKWSYYTTIQREQEHITGLKIDKYHHASDFLKSLPDAPPLASVAVR